MLRCSVSVRWLLSVQMNTTVESSPAANRDWLRPLRYLWRTPQLLLHALIAFPPHEGMSRVIGEWKHYHASQNRLA